MWKNELCDACLFRLCTWSQKSVLEQLNASHQLLVATAAFYLVAKKAQHVSCFCTSGTFLRLLVMRVISSVIHSYLNAVGAVLHSSKREIGLLQRILCVNLPFMTAFAPWWKLGMPSYLSTF